jgi:ribosomal protein S18 acetylase RimI-like enzyme
LPGITLQGLDSRQTTHSSLNELIELKKENAAEITAIHILAFPGFFLTDLGKNVLRVFYAALIQDESTIVWGIKNNKELVGFFVASTSPDGLYTRVFKKHLFKFFLPLTISFLNNISLLGRMMTSFSSSKAFEVPKAYSAALLSICVSPSFSGKGVGKLLLRKLENELVLKGQKGYYLTTDKENNEATNHFYLNNGFQVKDVFIQGNRIMNIYVKDIK